MAFRPNFSNSFSNPIQDPHLALITIIYNFLNERSRQNINDLTAAEAYQLLKYIEKHYEEFPFNSITLYQPFFENKFLNDPNLLNYFTDALDQNFSFANIFVTGTLNKKIEEAFNSDDVDFIDLGMHLEKAACNQPTIFSFLSQILQTRFGIAVLELTLKATAESIQTKIDSNIYANNQKVLRNLTLNLESINSKIKPNKATADIDNTFTVEEKMFADVNVSSMTSLIEEPVQTNLFKIPSVPRGSSKEPPTKRQKIASDSNLNPEKTKKLEDFWYLIKYITDHPGFSINKQKPPFTGEELTILLLTLKNPNYIPGITREIKKSVSEFILSNHKNIIDIYDNETEDQLFKYFQTLLKERCVVAYIFLDGSSIYSTSLRLRMEKIIRERTKDDLELSRNLLLQAYNHLFYPSMELPKNIFPTVLAHIHNAQAIEEIISYLESNPSKELLAANNIKEKNDVEKKQCLDFMKSRLKELSSRSATISNSLNQQVITQYTEYQPPLKGIVTSNSKRKADSLGSPSYQSSSPSYQSSSPSYQSSSPSYQSSSPSYQSSSPSYQSSSPSYQSSSPSYQSSSPSYQSHIPTGIQSVRSPGNQPPIYPSYQSFSNNQTTLFLPGSSPGNQNIRTSNPTNMSMNASRGIGRKF